MDGTQTELAAFRCTMQKRPECGGLKAHTNASKFQVGLRSTITPPSPPTSSSNSNQASPERIDARVTHFIPHVEDEFEYHGDSPFVPMAAGAIAGAMEHLCMYPVDTVKTRMQAVQPGQPVYSSVIEGFTSIVYKEGIPRLYRGVSAIVLAALPSHAIYFGTYEFCKSKLIVGRDLSDHNHDVHALSGAMAQIAHDAVVTPVDVVKQRMQLYGSQFTNVRNVVSSIIQKEGIGTFYASYPTTLIMNVPFISAHFVTYEFLKKYLESFTGESTYVDKSSPIIHMVAGAGAGALGGLVSNPFDVIKTRIQTDALPVKMRSLFGAFRHILAIEGVSGFTNGLSARVLYFTPSAAICWTTYEAMKRVLGWE